MTRRDRMSAPRALAAMLGSTLCLAALTAAPGVPAAPAIESSSVHTAVHTEPATPVPAPAGPARPPVAGPLARPADPTDDPDPDDTDDPDGSDDSGDSGDHNADRGGDSGVDIPPHRIGADGVDPNALDPGDRTDSGRSTGRGDTGTRARNEAPAPTGAARPHTTTRPTATHKRPPSHTPTATPAPASAGPCTLPVVPPKPVDASETPKPGQDMPAPLPLPAQPVGGPRLGECGNIVPAGAPAPPAVSDAASWILADLDTGAVLAARSPHARERPASCLKVLTALVALNRLDLNTVVQGTTADENADGSRVGVGPGGSYTVRQLLTGLILNSGNDAAGALARTLGGVPATLNDMTEQARRLGATDTRPTTPSGLDAPGMSTSAYDLALIFRAVIRNPTFAEISQTRLFDWPGRGTLPGFKISNQNEMLSEYPGTFGGKTGFTDDARHTRITAAERHGRRLVLVQMRSENHPVTTDAQAVQLLNYGFSLPATTPPVGRLVDGPPQTATPPAPTAADSAPAPRPAARSAENRTKALATVGGGAILGALLSVLIARRRSRPTGRHTSRA